MAKSKNSKGNKKYEILTKDLDRFSKLVQDHRKLLLAIGDL